MAAWSVHTHTYTHEVTHIPMANLRHPSAARSVLSQTHTDTYTHELTHIPITMQASIGGMERSLTEIHDKVLGSSGGASKGGAKSMKKE